MMEGLDLKTVQTGAILKAKPTMHCYDVLDETFV